MNSLFFKVQFLSTFYYRVTFVEHPRENLPILLEVYERQLSVLA